MIIAQSFTPGMRFSRINPPRRGVVSPSVISIAVHAIALVSQGVLDPYGWAN
jgi:hypothetical protein